LELSFYYARLSHLYGCSTEQKWLPFVVERDYFSGFTHGKFNYHHSRPRRRHRP
jgi:hypothetical protein